VDVRDKNVKEESEKGDTYSGFTSSSSSSFPYSLNHDNQPEDFMVPSRYSDNEINTYRLIDDVKMSKELPLIKNSTKKIVDTRNGTESLGSFKQSIKYPKVEDIEIFQEQHFKIQSSLKNRHRSSRHNHRHSKTHNTPTISCNGTKYYYKELQDRLKIRSDEIQNGTPKTKNEIQKFTVLRSSTLPSFRTLTKDIEMKCSDKDAKDMEFSAQGLGHTPLLHNSYNILNHNKFAGEEYDSRLSMQFPQRITLKRCIDRDALGSNAILKSESYVQDVTNLEEREQNVSDATEPPTRLGKPATNNIINDGLNNNVPRGVQSLLDKETNLLVEDNKIQNGTDTFLHLEKEIFNEKSDYYSRLGTKEDQDRSVKQNNSLMSEEDTLQLQNVALVTVGECDIHTASHVCCENRVIEEECPTYVANRTVYDFAVSMPYCNSRTKSCSDLTLPTHVSVRQNCQLCTSPVYSSSPRLATCDLVL
jgi:hypothetical protein